MSYSTVEKCTFSQNFCLFVFRTYKLHSGGIFSVFSIGDCAIIVRRVGAEKPDTGAESKINARIGGLEVK